MVQAGRIPLMPGATRVYFEAGRASDVRMRVDWPGWCRRGKDEEQALDMLRAYAPRYAVVAGNGAISSDFDVIGRVRGNATTDFGAPSVTGEWDARVAPVRRIVLPACSRRRGRFSTTSSRKPLQSCAKGRVAGARPRRDRRARPRGGAELRIKDRGAHAAANQLAGAARRLPRGDQSGHAGRGMAGPVRGRRLAWHVMDHAWEIEDRGA